MEPYLVPWRRFAGARVRAQEGGLINATYVVEDDAGPVAVVQRLHPVFQPTVNEDIAAVTAHLAARGMATPRLLPTDDGATHALDPDGRCWRALTWVPGRSWGRIQHPAMAWEAGSLVARWHRAVADLDHDFAFSRPGAHDTPRHVARLAEAVEAWPHHRLWEPVARLSEELGAAWSRWPGRLDLPLHVCHGDLKVSNLRFSDGAPNAATGVCLLDLDTMGWLPYDVELGDAWRSWCNPSAEDVAEARFDLEVFEASARGYLQANPLPAAEREALAVAPWRIALELAARFAVDALEERYFGWDPAVAPTRGDHNLQRARGQLALALDAAHHVPTLDRILRTD